MKIKPIFFGILVLISIFLVISNVTAVENNTDSLHGENLEIIGNSNENEILAIDNSEKVLEASNNDENILEIQNNTVEPLKAQNNNEEILTVQNDNESILKVFNNNDILGSYNTYYDVDYNYDSSVKECSHDYVLYTQHYGKQYLEVDAKDIKKLAIANANKKYKLITYETVKKQKVTIKYTKNFYRKFKEMGRTYKLSDKQWKKEVKKAKKLIKKGWKISKKTKNTIKLYKKVTKRTKIYFDLVNDPEGYDYWFTGYHSQYIRVYTNYYPYLDDDIAGVAW